MDPEDELDQLGIREVLDQDSRPTFCIDLDPDDESPIIDDAIHPVFCNAALRSHEKLLDAVTGRDASNPLSQAAFRDFRSWAAGVTAHDDSKDIFPLFFEYASLLWTGSTVRRRWRLISGNLLWRENAPSRDLASGGPIEVATGTAKGELTVDTSEERRSGGSERVQPVPGDASSTRPSTKLPTLASSKPVERLTFSVGSSSGTSSNSIQSILLSTPENAVPDWTVKNPTGKLSAHVEFARSVDWAATPLGPMETWSREFRQLVNLTMANPHPVSVTWGPDMNMIYNEAYAIEVAGNKHPALMGTGYAGPFSELWDGVAPIFAECARTGISIRRENDYLPIERYGLLEETFFSWSWTPIYGGTDRILGFYNAPFETTQMERNRRMLQTIYRLGECTSSAKSVKGFWKGVLAGLEENVWDVPFALLYSVGENDEGDHSSISSGSTMALKSCYFEGSLGIPEGHPAAPLQLDLKRSLEGFIPSFREAMRTREPTLLHTRDGTLPEALLEGIDWRGFGVPCNEAIIFPVRPTNGETVLAFLLVGMNPRRPYDEGYKSFVNMINRQLATSLASIILFEEEVRKSRDAAEQAALEQEKLSQQLALQTDRMRRMTEMSPLGMFLVTPEGVLREANDRFFEMTRVSRDAIEEMSWTEFVHPNTEQTMHEGWLRLVEERLPWSGEIQLKHKSPTSVDSDGKPFDTWVLFTAQPEFSPDSSIRSIMGSITDVSHFKWAQGVQNLRLHEAEENRRSQNEFIDLTSHELRNPLSAVLQCASDISSALEEAVEKGVAPSKATLESAIESAHTVLLCVQHQKIIVDDILTVSKLDSNLLLITPTPTEPHSVLRQAVKMLDPELQAKDIDLVFELHPSYTENNVTWANMDPSRVLQILINLLTNAIKFTAGMERRVISVAVGASPQPPSGEWIPGFQFVPASKRKNENITEGEDWGEGEDIFIRFNVEDTGLGLTEDEKQILFERFKQASPRTHAQYGGSGLGLFICKQLCELHGGGIGVASTAGVGSLFGFYIKAKRCATPQPSGPSLASRNIGDITTLSHPVAPIRQDLAGLTPGESLLATKAEVAFDPSTLHILVVEDNLINQRVLVKQLKKHVRHVGVANDGVEALEYLAETRFCKSSGQDLSIVLMDLEMPRMNGLDCVKHIRKMEKDGQIIGHVPVIAVTANVRSEQVNLAKDSGMDDVVAKPFTIPDLFKQVDALLRDLKQGVTRA